MFFYGDEAVVGKGRIEKRRWVHESFNCSRFIQRKLTCERCSGNYCRRLASVTPWCRTGHLSCWRWWGRDSGCHQLLIGIEGNFYPCHRSIWRAGRNAVYGEGFFGSLWSSRLDRFRKNSSWSTPSTWPRDPRNWWTDLFFNQTGKKGDLYRGWRNSDQWWGPGTCSRTRLPILWSRRKRIKGLWTKSFRLGFHP